MAATSRGGRKTGIGTKSAFKTQDKDQRDGCSWLDPSVISVVPYATAGLQGLYTQVTRREPALDIETKEFTDENGVFCPKETMPLLTRRYKYMDVIGRGGSSITVRAKDTFRPEDAHVAIKILNVNYYRLGYQESSCIRRLNKADPNGFSGTLRLLNMFSFSGHFCMVFEILHPKPLHYYFKEINTGQEKLKWIRRIAIRLLQVLGFLQQENVIHADLKPENVLLEVDDLSSGVKVIDFGNAIHCVYDELSLYYDDFELQTLLYRAPEVLFGLPFGPEIDMWSLGCILAELYMGKPLFFALGKDKLLQRMVSVLGPMPSSVFQRGKFFHDYSTYTGKPQTSLATWAKLHTEMHGVQDPHFISFISAMLQYNPSDRISVWDAFQHPFLAPEIAIRYLLPPSQSGDKKTYSKISISPKTYDLAPEVPASKDKLSSIDLLRQRVCSDDAKIGYRGRKGNRVIAQVTPFVKEPERTYRPAFPLTQDRPAERSRAPAFQVPPVVTDAARNGLQQGEFSRQQRRRFGSQVRQPIPVPGQFSNSLIPEKCAESLTNKVSDLYAQYQNSLNVEKTDSTGVITEDEAHPYLLENLPSTSSSRYSGLMKSNEKRKLFHSDEGDIARTVSKIVQPSVIQVNRVSADSDPKLIGERYLIEHDGMNSEQELDDRSASIVGSKKEQTEQRSEIILTKVDESNKTSEKKVTDIVSDSGSDKRASPMRRWANLQKMRNSKLIANKSNISRADKHSQERGQETEKLASSSTQCFKSEPTNDTFSKQTLAEETNRQMSKITSIKVSPGFRSTSRNIKTSPGFRSPARNIKSSIGLGSPSRNIRTRPVTSSKLAISITKLKASTPPSTKPRKAIPITPEGASQPKSSGHSTPQSQPSSSTPLTPGDQVLLISEFPTPDNADTPIHTPDKADMSISPDQSPLSEGSHALSDQSSLSEGSHASPFNSELVSQNLKSSEQTMKLATTHDLLDIMDSESGEWDVVRKRSGSADLKRQPDKICSSKKESNQKSNVQSKPKRTKCTEPVPELVAEVPQKVTSIEINCNKRKVRESNDRTTLTPLPKKKRPKSYSPGSSVKRKSFKISTNVRNKSSPDSSLKNVQSSNRSYSEKICAPMQKKSRNTVRKRKANSPKSPSISNQSKNRAAKRTRTSPKSTRTSPKSTRTSPKSTRISPKSTASASTNSAKDLKQNRKASSTKQRSVRQGKVQKRKNLTPNQGAKRKLDTNDPYEYKDTPKKVPTRRRAKQKAVANMRTNIGLVFGASPHDDMWVPGPQNDVTSANGSRRKWSEESDDSGPVEEDILSTLDQNESPDKIQTEEAVPMEDLDNPENEDQERSNSPEDEVLLL